MDCGLGKRETLARLAANEPNVEHIDGILITHEHIDHCNGLPQMLGLWKAPLYVTEPTMDALRRTLPETLGKRLKGLETIRPGQNFSIGDIDVHAFAIPHDAADPIAFTFRANGSKVAVLTDLGYMHQLAKQELKGSDCIILESNHESEMLKMGPYPWVVKQRIMGKHGHLSNNDVSQYLADPEGFDGRARYLVLAHLSEENNNPDTATISANEALNRRPAECAFHGELLIARQDRALRPLEI